MLKKFIIFIFIYCSLSSIVFAYDRYIYLGEDVSNNEHYIDTQTISYVSNNIIKFWIKTFISDSERKRIALRNMGTEGNNLRKKLWPRISYILAMNEVNISQNTYHTVESVYYSKKGAFLFSDPPLKSWEGWQNIKPDSIIESAIRLVQQIFLNNSNKYTQPFIAPRSNFFDFSSLTPQQREEYRKLQDYIAWVVAQPDFKEYDNWFTSKLREKNVSSEQFNFYLYEYMKKNNYRFTLIIEMLSNWYREFQMLKYGIR